MNFMFHLVPSYKKRKKSYFILLNIITTLLMEKLFTVRMPMTALSLKWRDTCSVCQCHKSSLRLSRRSELAARAALSLQTNVCASDSDPNGKNPQFWETQGLSHKDWQIQEPKGFKYNVDLLDSCMFCAHNPVPPLRDVYIAVCDSRSVEAWFLALAFMPCVGSPPERGLAKQHLDAG